MSGTKQNPYPICVKCGTGLNPQDSRGWEKIRTPDLDKDEPSFIWLCPNCIYGFQAARDLAGSEIEVALEEIGKAHDSFGFLIGRIFYKIFKRK